MLNAVSLEVEDIDLHASVRCSGGKTLLPDIQVDAFWTKNPPENVNSLVAKTGPDGDTPHPAQLQTRPDKSLVQSAIPVQVHGGVGVVPLDDSQSWLGPKNWDLYHSLETLQLEKIKVTMSVIQQYQSRV